MDELYLVNVSSLEIRKEPYEPSKVCLKKDTVVKRMNSKTRQHRKEEWILVSTVSNPIISGYIPKKYLTKI